MNRLSQIIGLLSRWMDDVAICIVAILDRLVAPQKVRLVEKEHGEFALQVIADDLQPAIAPMKFSDKGATCSLEAEKILRGSRVEVTLRPDRFFFRPLELPRRASEFLDGIVRAQIDRITPWNSSEAVYGWSEPTEISKDRISVMVAAAARNLVVPIAQALGRIGAKSIIMLTALPDARDGYGIVNVFEQSTAGALEANQIRRKLLIVLMASALLSGLAIASDIILGNDLLNRQQDVSRRIAERRGIISAGTDAVANSALSKLARRKYQTPASVIVLDALSNVLPDNTYVTELRIEGDKVQVVGISNDAPSLIRKLEESPHFSHATFFAPTTRSPSESGDRFHIEARVKPLFAAPL